jgi:hypothetical protein
LTGLTPADFRDNPSSVFQLGHETCARRHSAVDRWRRF